MVILSGHFSYSKFKVSCITSSRVISWNIQFYTSSKIILLRQNLNNNHWDDVDMFHVSIIFTRLHPSTKNYPRIFPLRQNFQPPMEIPQVSSHHFRSKIPRPPLLKRCTARKSQGERILGMIRKRMGIWIFKWSKFEKKTSRWLKQKIRWWMMLFHVFFPGFSNKQINEANDRTSCIQRWARRGSPALKRASMTFAAAKNLWCLNFMMYILHPRKMKRPETWRIHPLEEENHLNQTIIHFQVLWKRFLKAYHFICGVVGHCQRTEVPQFPPIESLGLWVVNYVPRFWRLCVYGQFFRYMFCAYFCDRSIIILSPCSYISYSIALRPKDCWNLPTFFYKPSWHLFKISNSSQTTPP